MAAGARPAGGLCWRAHIHPKYRYFWPAVGKKKALSTFSNVADKLFQSLLLASFEQ